LKQLALQTDPICNNLGFKRNEPPASPKDAIPTWQAPRPPLARTSIGARMPATPAHS